MKNLTKLKKVAVLITLFWMLFVYCVNYNSYVNRLDVKDFILVNVPLIIYWSIVWLCGFGGWISSLKICKNYIIKKYKIKIQIQIQNIYINYKKIFFSFFLPSFICLIFLVYENNLENERARYLNKEVKHVATYLGWKWRETEFMYDYCSKHGYKINNYRNEFFNLTIEEERKTKELFIKLRPNEIDKLNEVIRQVLQVVYKSAEKELNDEISKIKNQYKNITEKDLCKEIDVNAKEILSNRYHTEIKRKFDGKYTAKELEFIGNTKRMVN